VSVLADEWHSSKKAVGDVVVNRALRRIFLAFAGSLIGDGVFALSSAIYIYRHGGATAVGLLAIVRYLSISAVAPFTSMLADHFERKYVMVGADLVRLALVSAAALAVATRTTASIVDGLIVVVGLAGTAFRPAQASILPSLARRDDEVAGANVVSSTIESVGFFAGPALAGLLLAFTNITVAFSFDALTFLWSALLVLSIQPPRDEERDDDFLRALRANENHGDDRAQSFLARASEGFRAVARYPDIRALAILYFLQCVVAGASAVFTVAIALKMLHVGNSGLGLMESTLGIGGLIGGFVALMLMPRARLATHFGIGVMLWGAPLVLIAVFPDLAAALVTMGIIGVANSVVDINALTVLQHVVPNDVLGRVMGAIETGDVAGMAVGSLAMTVLIHVTGLRVGLATIGVVVTILVLPGLPALRRIDGVARTATLPTGGHHHHRHLAHRRLRHRLGH